MRKALLCAGLVLMLSAVVSAQNPETLEDALAESARLSKPILIEFSLED